MPTIDRVSMAIDVIDRVPKLMVVGAHVKEMLKDEQISCTAYAYAHGIDRPDPANWKQPY
jgi:xylulose-5-phosphate/fructose-6-phosphate phosphoketolase